MKQERQSSLGLYTIVIAALFLAGFFLLVVFGAQSYRNTVSGQSRNMESRALLSYLSTTVKAYDARDAVAVREDKDVGQVLILRDGTSGYALRIYRQNDWLLEDYAEENAALRPEEAQQIGKTGRFSVKQTDDSTMMIGTDAGSVLLHLRSGEVGA